MPFNHNDHYHRLLLRQLPRDCRRALDVGCGTGRFARELASRNVLVDALDPCAEVIRHARASNPGRVRFRQADITATALPPGHYDVITCLASLHHVPFDTVTALRSALAPGGVLLVLGCYREQWPADMAVNLSAAAANAAARSAVAMADRLRGRDAPPRPPVTVPEMTLSEVRHRAAVLLPGSATRRLLFWRYLLRFQR